MDGTELNFVNNQEYKMNRLSNVVVGFIIQHPHLQLMKAIVVNFGGQYAHLIARRLREAGLYAELVWPEEALDAATKPDVVAIVLSGGPSSVLDNGAPTISSEIFDLGKPVLGICFGHQLIAKLLGGEVAKGAGEYGDTKIRILKRDEILQGFDDEEVVWMSHGDYVAKEPPGFEVLALSEEGYIAAMKSENVYGVQFHPEVAHTPKGRILFENFVTKIVGIKPEERWNPVNEIPRLLEEIRRTVGSEDRVVIGVSGGVDSTVTAVLLVKALGERAVPIFVNHGLFRQYEAEEVLRMFQNLGIKVKYVDASEEFLKQLEGTFDCEDRRKIVGKLFVDVFTKAASEVPNAKWLAQGTLYPDVIESGAVRGADRIKSHHNVAGLPEGLKFKLLEPLRQFYKDEVRAIGKALGLPDEVVFRHPFPGPGLAVRVIGKFNREKLEIVRKASYIVEEELKKANLYDKVWQAFATVGDDTWVGVKGDARVLGYVVVVRVMQSEDAMTADWVMLERDLLSRISHRITSEIPKVTMVAYAVTPKPPSTIEPC